MIWLIVCMVVGVFIGFAVADRWHDKIHQKYIRENKVLRELVPWDDLIREAMAKLADSVEKKNATKKSL